MKKLLLAVAALATLSIANDALARCGSCHEPKEKTCSEPRIKCERTVAVKECVKPHRECNEFCPAGSKQVETGRMHHKKRRNSMSETRSSKTKQQRTANGYKARATDYEDVY